MKKKLSVLVLMLFTTIFGLVACGKNPYDQVSLTVSKTDLSIMLSEENGVYSSSPCEIEVKVTAPKKLSKEIVLPEYGSKDTSGATYGNRYVEIEKIAGDVDGEYTLKITGKEPTPGAVEIPIKTVDGNKSQTLKINVGVEVNGIEFAKDINLVCPTGGEIDFNAKLRSYINFTPTATNQTGVEFYLAGIYNGVTIQNNVLKIPKDYVVSGDETILVKAKSTERDGIETSTMAIKVIKGFNFYSDNDVNSANVLVNISNTQGTTNCNVNPNRMVVDGNIINYEIELAAIESEEKPEDNPPYLISLLTMFLKGYNDYQIVLNEKSDNILDLEAESGVDISQGSETRGYRFDIHGKAAGERSVVFNVVYNGTSTNELSEYKIVVTFRVKVLPSVKNVLLNDGKYEEGATLTVFKNYTASVIGAKLKIQDTAASSDMTFTVNVAGNDESVMFYDQYGTRIEDITSHTFKNGTLLYLRHSSDTGKLAQINITLCSEFYTNKYVDVDNNKNSFVFTKSFTVMANLIGGESNFNFVDKDGNVVEDGKNITIEISGRESLNPRAFVDFGDEIIAQDAIYRISMNNATIGNWAYGDRNGVNKGKIMFTPYFPSDEADYKNFKPSGSTITVEMVTGLTKSVYVDVTLKYINSDYANENVGDALFTFDYDTQNKGFLAAWYDPNNGDDNVANIDFNKTDGFYGDSYQNSIYRQVEGSNISYTTFNRLVVAKETVLKLDVYRLFAFDGQVKKIAANAFRFDYKTQYMFFDTIKGELRVGKQTSNIEGEDGEKGYFTLSIIADDKTFDIRVYVVDKIEEAKLNTNYFEVFAANTLNVADIEKAFAQIQLVINSTGTYYGNLFQSFSLFKADEILYSADEQFIARTNLFADLNGDVLMTVSRVEYNGKMYYNYNNNWYASLNDCVGDTNKITDIATELENCEKTQVRILKAIINIAGGNVDYPKIVAALFRNGAYEVEFTGTVSQYYNTFDENNFVVKIKNPTMSRSISVSANKTTGLYYEVSDDGGTPVESKKSNSFAYWINPDNTLNKNVFVTIYDTMLKDGKNEINNPVLLKYTINGVEYAFTSCNDYIGMKSNGNVADALFEIKINNGSIEIINLKAKAGNYICEIGCVDQFNGVDYQNPSCTARVDINIADGSEQNKYQIRNYADFEAFLNNDALVENKYYVLTTDISLNRQYVNANYVLNNNLSGMFTSTSQNQTYKFNIYGLNLKFSEENGTKLADMALFARVGADNLKLEYITIENFVITVESSQTNEINVAALVAKAEKGLQLLNCRVTGSINIKQSGSGAVNVGGVVGQATATMFKGLPSDSVINNANVNSNVAIEVRVLNGTSAVYAGGLVGKTTEKVKIDQINVISKIKTLSYMVTENEGQKTEKDTGFASNAYTGGVVGYAKVADINFVVVYPVIAGCQNVGGVAGFVGSGSIQNTQVQMLYNLNMKNIIAGYNNVGGVVGYVDNSLTTDYVYVRSYTSKNMLGYSGEGSEIGVDYNINIFTDIAKGYYGAVVLLTSSSYAGTQAAGGIVGCAGELTLNNTYFNSHIRSNAPALIGGTRKEYVGGFVGDNTGKKITLNNSYVDVQVVVNGQFRAVSGSNNLTADNTTDYGAPQVPSINIIKSGSKTIANNGDYLIATHTAKSNKIATTNEIVKAGSQVAQFYAKINGTLFGVADKKSNVVDNFDISYSGLNTGATETTILMFNANGKLYVSAYRKKLATSPLENDVCEYYSLNNETVIDDHTKSAVNGIEIFIQNNFKEMSTEMFKNIIGYNFVEAGTNNLYAIELNSAMQILGNIENSDALNTLFGGDDSETLETKLDNLFSKKDTSDNDFFVKSNKSEDYVLNPNVMFTKTLNTKVVGLGVNSRGELANAYYSFDFDETTYYVNPMSTNGDYTHKWYKQFNPNADPIDINQHILDNAAGFNKSWRLNFNTTKYNNVETLYVNDGENKVIVGYYYEDGTTKLAIIYDEEIGNYGGKAKVYAISGTTPNIAESNTGYYYGDPGTYLIKDDSQPVTVFASNAGGDTEKAIYIVDINATTGADLNSQVVIGAYTSIIGNDGKTTIKVGRANTEYTLVSGTLYDKAEKEIVLAEGENYYVSAALSVNSEAKYLSSKTILSIYNQLAKESDASHTDVDSLKALFDENQFSSFDGEIYKTKTYYYNGTTWFEDKTCNNAVVSSALLDALTLEYTRQKGGAPNKDDKFDYNMFEINATLNGEGNWVFNGYTITDQYIIDRLNANLKTEVEYDSNSDSTSEKYYNEVKWYLDAAKSEDKVVKDISTLNNLANFTESEVVLSSNYYLINDAWYLVEQNKYYTNNFARYWYSDEECTILVTDKDILLRLNERYNGLNNPQNAEFTLTVETLVTDKTLLEELDTLERILVGANRYQAQRKYYRSSVWTTADGTKVDAAATDNDGNNLIEKLNELLASAKKVSNTTYKIYKSGEKLDTYYYNGVDWYADKEFKTKITDAKVLDKINKETREVVVNGIKYYSSDLKDWFKNSNCKDNQANETELASIASQVPYVNVLTEYWSYDEKYSDGKNYVNNVNDEFVLDAASGRTDLKISFSFTINESNFSGTIEGNKIVLKNESGEIVGGYQVVSIKDGKMSIIDNTDSGKIISSITITSGDDKKTYKWAVTDKLNNGMPVMIKPYFYYDGTEAKSQYDLWYDTLASLDLVVNDFISSESGNYVYKVGNEEFQGHILYNLDTAVLMYNSGATANKENLNTYTIEYGTNPQGYYVAVLNGTILEIGALRIDKESASQIVVSSSNSNVVAVEEKSGVFKLKVYSLGTATITFYNLKDDGINVKFNIAVVRGFTGFNVVADEEITRYYTNDNGKNWYYSENCENNERVANVSGLEDLDLIDLGNGIKYVDKINKNTQPTTKINLEVGVDKDYFFGYVNNLNGVAYTANTSGFQVIVKSVDGYATLTNNASAIKLNDQLVNGKCVGDVYEFTNATKINIMGVNKAGSGVVMLDIVPFIMVNDSKVYMDTLSQSITVNVLAKATAISFADDSANILAENEKEITLDILSNNSINNQFLNLSILGNNGLDLGIEFIKLNSSSKFASGLYYNFNLVRDKYVTDEALINWLDANSELLTYTKIYTKYAIRNNVTYFKSVSNRDDIESEKWYCINDINLLSLKLKNYKFEAGTPSTSEPVLNNHKYTFVLALDEDKYLSLYDSGVNPLSETKTFNITARPSETILGSNLYSGFNFNISPNSVKSLDSYFHPSDGSKEGTVIEDVWVGGPNIIDPDEKKLDEEYMGTAKNNRLHISIAPEYNNVLVAELEFDERYLDYFTVKQESLMNGADLVDPNDPNKGIIYKVGEHFNKLTKENIYVGNRFVLWNKTVYSYKLGATGAPELTEFILGQYYVNFEFKENIPQGIDFPITINLYDRDRNLIETTTKNIRIEVLPTVSISLDNGEDIIGRGEVEPITITANNIDSDITLDVNDNVARAIKYKNDDGELVAIEKVNNVFTLDLNKKYYIDTASYTGSISDETNLDDIAYDIRLGVLNTLKISATKNVSSLKFDAKKTLNFTIVEFTIKNITVQGVDDNNIISKENGSYEVLKAEIIPNNAALTNTNIKNVVDSLSDQISKITEADGDPVKYWSVENSDGGWEEIQIGKRYNYFKAVSYTSVADAMAHYLRLTAKSVGDSMLRLGLYYRYGSDGKISVCDKAIDAADNKYPYYISYNFTLSVYDQTDEDNPTPISTAEEFLNMQNGVSYILQNDIELTAWKPIDFAGSYLDGNGFVIKINSFDLTEEKGKSEAYVGLFRNVKEGQMIKNIIIDISDLLIESGQAAKFVSGETTDKPNIDLRETNTVYFGVMAANNEGILENIKVVSFLITQNPRVLYVATTRGYYEAGSESYDSTVGYMGVLVGANSGVISDCMVGTRDGGVVQTFVLNRAGDISDTTEGRTVGEFTFMGCGNVAGFAATNSGTITNSMVRDVNITNVVRVSERGTSAGFVCQNNGKIYSCVVTTSNIEKYRASRTILTSSTTTAGFVHTNTKVVEDCYTNIQISNSSTKTAGFVFDNGEGGSITNCYTTTRNTIAQSSTSHYFFARDNDSDNNDQYKMAGTVKNCYYVVLQDEGIFDTTKNLDPVICREYDPAIPVILKTNDQIDADLFSGFTFVSGKKENDGVWYTDGNTLPQLINCEYVEIYTSRQLVGAQEAYFGISGSTVTFYSDSKGLNKTGETKIESGEFVYSKLTFTVVDANTIETSEDVEIKIEDGLFYYSGYDKFTYEDVLNSKGSKHNPLLITSAEEFGRYIVKNSAMKGGEFVFGGTFGNDDDTTTANYVKLIQDLDFSDKRLTLSYDVNKVVGKKSITDVVFKGVLIGNSMTLSNIVLTDESKTEKENWGLFSKIGGETTPVVGTSQASVFNLKLEYREVSSENANNVGILAGTIYNASIIKIDINGPSNGSDSDVISGKKMVGGLAGLIVGEKTKISEINTNNVRVKATYVTSAITKGVNQSNEAFALTSKYTVLDPNYTKYVYKDENERIHTIMVDTDDLVGIVVDDNNKLQTNYSDKLYMSYAGSVAGVVIGNSKAKISDHNLYNGGGSSSPTYAEVRKTVTTYQNMSVKGAVSVSAMVAGGVFGYAGGFDDKILAGAAAGTYEGRTLKLKDISLELSSGDDTNPAATQNIYGRAYTGGLIGYGYNLSLEGGRVEHAETVQDEIDSKINSITADSISSNNLFTSISGDVDAMNIATGGLIGLSNFTAIVDSYSKVNVVNKNTYIAGGAVGQANEMLYMAYVYTTGNVDSALMMGGLIGYKTFEDVPAGITDTKYYYLDFQTHYTKDDGALGEYTNKLYVKMPTNEDGSLNIDAFNGKKHSETTIKYYETLSDLYNNKNEYTQLIFFDNEQYGYDADTGKVLMPKAYEDGVEVDGCAETKKMIYTDVEIQEGKVRADYNDLFLFNTIAVNVWGIQARDYAEENNYFTVYNKNSIKFTESIRVDNGTPIVNEEYLNLSANKTFKKHHNFGYDGENYVYSFNSTVDTLKNKVTLTSEWGNSYFTDEYGAKLGYTITTDTKDGVYLKMDGGATGTKTVIAYIKIDVLGSDIQNPVMPEIGNSVPEYTVFNLTAGDKKFRYLGSVLGRAGYAGVTNSVNLSATTKETDSIENVEDAVSALYKYKEGKKQATTYGRLNALELFSRKFNFKTRTVATGAGETGANEYYEYRYNNNFFNVISSTYGGVSHSGDFNKGTYISRINSDALAINEQYVDGNFGTDTIKHFKSTFEPVVGKQAYVSYITGDFKVSYDQAKKIDALRTSFTNEFTTNWGYTTDISQRKNAHTAVANPVENCDGVCELFDPAFSKITPSSTWYVNSDTYLPKFGFTTSTNVVEINTDWDLGIAMTYGYSGKVYKILKNHKGKGGATCDCEKTCECWKSGTCDPEKKGVECGHCQIGNEYNIENKGANTTISNNVYVASQTDEITINIKLGNSDYSMFDFLSSCSFVNITFVIDANYRNSTSNRDGYLGMFANGMRGCSFINCKFLIKNLPSSPLEKDTLAGQETKIFGSLVGNALSCSFDNCEFRIIDGTTEISGASLVTAGGMFGTVTSTIFTGCKMISTEVWALNGVGVSIDKTFSFVSGYSGEVTLGGFIGIIDRSTVKNTTLKADGISKSFSATINNSTKARVGAVFGYIKNCTLLGVNSLGVNLAGVDFKDGDSILRKGDDPSITNDKKGVLKAGILAGEIDSSNILICQVAGNITFDETTDTDFNNMLKQYYIGIIAGYDKASTIAGGTRSSNGGNASTITYTAKSNSYGSNIIAKTVNLGGLVGGAYQTKIDNTIGITKITVLLNKDQAAETFCGAVTGDENCGMLNIGGTVANSNDVKITDSYTAGDIEVKGGKYAIGNYAGRANIGGMVGYAKALSASHVATYGDILYQEKAVTRKDTTAGAGGADIKDINGVNNYADAADNALQIYGADNKYMYMGGFAGYIDSINRTEKIDCVLSFTNFINMSVYTLYESASKVYYPIVKVKGAKSINGLANLSSSVESIVMTDPLQFANSQFISEFDPETSSDGKAVFFGYNRNYTYIVSTLTNKAADGKKDTFFTKMEKVFKTNTGVDGVGNEAILVDMENGHYLPGFVIVEIDPATGKSNYSQKEGKNLFTATMNLNEYLAKSSSKYTPATHDISSNADKNIYVGTRDYMVLDNGAATLNGGKISVGQGGLLTSQGGGAGNGVLLNGDGLITKNEGVISNIAFLYYGTANKGEIVLTKQDKNNYAVGADSNGVYSVVLKENYGDLYNVVIASGASAAGDAYDSSDTVFVKTANDIDVKLAPIGYNYGRMFKSGVSFKIDGTASTEISYVTIRHEGKLDEVRQVAYGPNGEIIYGLIEERVEFAKKIKVPAYLGEKTQLSMFMINNYGEIKESFSVGSFAGTIYRDAKNEVPETLKIRPLGLYNAGEINYFMLGGSITEEMSHTVQAKDKDGNLVTNGDGSPKMVTRVTDFGSPQYMGNGYDGGAENNASGFNIQDNDYKISNIKMYTKDDADKSIGKFDIGNCSTGYVAGGDNKIWVSPNGVTKINDGYPYIRDGIQAKTNNYNGDVVEINTREDLIEFLAAHNAFLDKSLNADPTATEPIDVGFKTGAGATGRLKNDAGDEVGQSILFNLNLSASEEPIPAFKLVLNGKSDTAKVSINGQISGLKIQSTNYKIKEDFDQANNDANNGYGGLIASVNKFSAITATISNVTTWKRTFNSQEEYSDLIGENSGIISGKFESISANAVVGTNNNSIQATVTNNRKSLNSFVSVNTENGKIEGSNVFDSSTFNKYFAYENKGTISQNIGNDTADDIVCGNYFIGINSGNITGTIKNVKVNGYSFIQWNTGKGTIRFITNCKVNNGATVSRADNLDKKVYDEISKDEMLGKTLDAATGKDTAMFSPAMVVYNQGTITKIDTCTAYDCVYVMNGGSLTVNNGNYYCSDAATKDTSGSIVGNNLGSEKATITTTGSVSGYGIYINKNKHTDNTFTANGGAKFNQYALYENANYNVIAPGFTEPMGKLTLTLSGVTITNSETYYVNQNDANAKLDISTTDGLATGVLLTNNGEVKLTINGGIYTGDILGTNSKTASIYVYGYGTANSVVKTNSRGATVALASAHYTLTSACIIENSGTVGTYIDATHNGIDGISSSSNGLVGKNTSAGIISGVIIKNMTIDSTAEYVGAVCGENYGVIDNCNVCITAGNSLNIVANNTISVSSLGGAVGYSRGGSLSYIKVGSANINKKDNFMYNVGGIVGCVSDNATLIQLQMPSGWPSVINTKAVNLGGIIGSISNSTMNAYSGFGGDYYSYAEINYYGGNNSAYTSVGGVIGYATNLSIGSSTELKNYNPIWIRVVDSRPTHVGGVIGDAYNLSSGYGKLENNGKIGLMAESAGYVVGGVVGYANSSVSVTEVRFSGTIDASGVVVTESYTGTTSYNGSRVYYGGGTGLTESQCPFNIDNFIHMPNSTDSSDASYSETIYAITPASGINMICGSGRIETPSENYKKGVIENLSLYAIAIKFTGYATIQQYYVHGNIGAQYQYINYNYSFLYYYKTKVVRTQTGSTATDVENSSMVKNCSVITDQSQTINGVIWKRTVNIPFGIYLQRQLYYEGDSNIKNGKFTYQEWNRKNIIFLEYKDSQIDLKTAKTQLGI